MYKRQVQQRVLKKEVAAGVAGQAKFGQHQHLSPQIGRTAHSFQDLTEIMITVSDPQLWACSRDLDEAVFHFFVPPAHQNAPGRSGRQNTDQLPLLYPARGRDCNPKPVRDKIKKNKKLLLHKLRSCLII